MAGVGEFCSDREVVSAAVFEDYVRAADSGEELVLIVRVFGRSTHNGVAVVCDSEPGAFTGAADKHAVLDAKTAHHIRSAHIEEVGVDSRDNVFAVRDRGGELFLHICNCTLLVRAVGGHRGQDSRRARLYADSISANVCGIFIGINDLGVDDAGCDLDRGSCCLAELIRSVWNVESREVSAA